MKSIIVGICGGTASGKTTLAQKIAHSLNNDANILSLDNYYRSFSGTLEELSKINYDHPKSLDIELFSRHIKQLKECKTVGGPIYDFANHGRAQEKIKLEPRSVTIVEGLFLYNIGVPDELFDLKVFMDTPADLRFIRRLIRDREERGRSVESVINQYLDSVRRMHEKYVEPNREISDVIFHGALYTGEDLQNLVSQIKSLR